jgi:quercetin 2,3-dioxygenase
MITIRKADDRGHFDHGWLDTYHTFSFGDYHDGRNMGFRALRVINEDVVQAGQRFGTHGHSDMEIVTYVLEGELAHKDSMGNGSTIVPGDVQYMSAGTGVRHSEANASADKPVHLYQIWILPERNGETPRYDQKTFDEASKSGKLRLVVSGTGADGSIAVRQDVNLYASVLKAGESAALTLPVGRHLWVQALRGALDVNGKHLTAGDGLAASGETAFKFAADKERAEFLAFDLA